MLTEMENKFIELGLPPSDESLIEHGNSNPVRNPLPSEMRVGDYYTNRSGWQRRYIVQINRDEKLCYYVTYFVEGYAYGNSFYRESMTRIPANSGIWEMSYEQWYCCSLAHIRSWSQK